MRMHPDIGLVIADLLQLARFWLCKHEMHIKRTKSTGFQSEQHLVS